MTASPGQDPRPEVSPPRESSARALRGGYVALSVSGLVLVTAFAAVAQIAGGGESSNAQARTAAHGKGTGNGSSGSTELVPGQAVPGETKIVVDGVAVTGSMPTETTAPTTVVSVGPDGEATTTVIPPSTHSRTSTHRDPPDDTSGPATSSSEATSETPTGSETPPSETQDDSEPPSPTDKSDGSVTNNTTGERVSR
jgi:hypothetical protein